MNSVIEAQQQFTECFGELTIRHLCGELTLPSFSNEVIELEEFIKTHQRPAPVVVRFVSADHPLGFKRYLFR